MEDLRQRLRELPCGRRLIEAAAATGGVHLVGGAVRDLLLGRAPRELDVVVEGDVDALAARLAGGAEGAAAAVAHERFGTATVRAGDCRWDLAAARAESYSRPGALPDVRPAGIDADLSRRDVTVNALALDLATGELRTAAHARKDLAEGRLRVLHDASFVDDPTRLWRVARYGARLGFGLEEHTARLARAAVRAGALDTVSGARIGNELRLALAEPDPIAALEAAAALGVAPWLEPDRALAERALALLPAGEGRRDLLVLAAALAAPADAALQPAGEGRRDLLVLAAALAAPADALLADLQFSAAERAILRACAAAPALDDAPRAPSALARALRGQPVEAVALAGARGSGAAAARRWLEDLRHVGLQISGDDLRAAGVPEGADLGRRLQAVLDRRLDGELAADRDAQLAAALALAPPAGTA